MIKWLNIPVETRINAYNQVAEHIGIPPSVAEKDWWVVRTLEIIFKTNVANHLVFKGGTSLSKSWNLIHRFSEDIDLAIDRKFLGFDGVLSGNKRTQLRKEANKYTSEYFFIELQEKFKEQGFKNLKFNLVEAKGSDHDPRIIEIYYPNVIESLGYVKPRIQIEIGCRSLIEPYSLRPVTSFLDDLYAGRDFSESPVEIPTVNPERTFLEKLFLLHEEFHKPLEKIRVDRLSRHVYDVYQLSKTSFSNAIEDRNLYKTIVEHRFNFTKVAGVDYNLLAPKTLDFIPIDKVIDAWENDYRKMREEMIYQSEAPTFDEIIEQLNLIKNKINEQVWDLGKTYPNP
ncbi:MAG: nucleotidyl transferase AbiEii/AbiGii toxin family protein [Flavobacteriaceae bacterium]|jgi:predicted nucleotidyltransferase component of viral defense system|nr:nucleotidyl transferase AbiEii/AbiGii toxin family protein [Flavobacteriaceae bacterium]